jgi:BirA family biotin operon repressor/biotin-[acetyl-CoA-carboxylase] ligase
MKRTESPRRSARTDAKRRRLLAILADGEFHSGEDIAGLLSVSRSAVWKHLKWLRSLDVEVEAIPRRGYRLARSVELLQDELILDGLSPRARECLADLEIPLVVESTNLYLIEADAPPPGRARACMAEIQTSGRGRRGRSWLAPFGSALCMSLAWSFVEVPGTFPALGLAAGVAVAAALERLGIRGIGLKWPNDLVCGQRKIGGILVEVRSEPAGGMYVVVGVGLNVWLPATVRLRLAEHHGVRVTDLHEIAGSETPGRNRLAAALLETMTLSMAEFERCGFDAFLPAWSARDVMRDVPVKLAWNSGTVEGIARGVASDGALLLDRNGTLERFVAGEISLRPARG